MEIANDISEVIEQWCPEHHRSQPNEVRLVAALLEANACVTILREIAEGKDPIRPLDSFKPFKDRPLESKVKQFTVYWRTGERNVYQGETIEDAVSKAGYASGAVYLVDFYAEGDNHAYEWLDHGWKKK